MSNYNYKYYPRRPVKSFQDLEVYQKTLGLGVEIVKKIRNISEESKHTFEVQDKLVKTTLRIPKLIASAHSLRFGDSQKAVAFLEKAMLGCNLAVYYLELYRDLANPVQNTPEESGPTSGVAGDEESGPTSKVSKKKIEVEYFEEQIKEYLRVRGKIMRLQRSWLKFMSMKGKNE